MCQARAFEFGPLRTNQLKIGVGVLDESLSRSESEINSSCIVHVTASSPILVASSAQAIDLDCIQKKSNDSVTHLRTVQLPSCASDFSAISDSSLHNAIPS